MQLVSYVLQQRCCMITCPVKHPGASGWGPPLHRLCLALLTDTCRPTNYLRLAAGAEWNEIRAVLNWDNMVGLVYIHDPEQDPQVRAALG